MAKAKFLTKKKEVIKLFFYFLTLSSVKGGLVEIQVQRKLSQIWKENLHSVKFANFGLISKVFKSDSKIIISLC